MRTDDDTDTDAIARRVATQRTMANEHAHVLACASLALCAPKAWEDAANVTNASAEDARARRERREVSRAWRAARDEEAARRRAEEDAREEDARAARRRDLEGERRAREARVRRRVETRREAARAEKEKMDGRLERQTSKAANAAMIEMFQVRACARTWFHRFLDLQRGGDSNRIESNRRDVGAIRKTNKRSRSLARILTGPRRVGRRPSSRGGDTPRARIHRARTPPRRGDIEAQTIHFATTRRRARVHRKRRKTRACSARRSQSRPTRGFRRRTSAGVGVKHYVSSSDARVEAIRRSE